MRFLCIISNLINCCSFAIPCFMTAASLVFVTVVLYGAFRPVCQGPMWDACYSRTFHVFDLETECPCVVYFATVENKEPWSCNNDRDCAEYEWCTSNLFHRRKLACIPSVCPRNTEISCRDENHVQRDCSKRRELLPEILDACKNLRSDWAGEYEILEKYYPTCHSHSDCEDGYYCRRGGFSPVSVALSKTTSHNITMANFHHERSQMTKYACRGFNGSNYPAPTGPNRCSKCEHCVDLNDCPSGPDADRCAPLKNYTTPTLSTNDLPTIWKAMETHAKNSLVIFAIAKRPLTGSLDLENISKFEQLHTFVLSDVALLDQNENSVVEVCTGDQLAQSKSNNNIKDSSINTLLKCNETVNPEDQAAKEYPGHCSSPSGFAAKGNLTSGFSLQKSKSSRSSSTIQGQHQSKLPQNLLASNGTFSHHNSSKQDKNHVPRNSSSEEVTIKTKRQNEQVGKQPRNLSSKSRSSSGKPEHGSQSGMSKGNSASGQGGQNKPAGGSNGGGSGQTSGGGGGRSHGSSTQKESDPLVHLTLPLPLNGCTSGQESQCALRLEVFIVNKYNVNVTFATKGGCDDSPPGFMSVSREPKLRVVKLSRLSHSKLHEIPNDFICDDRRSLMNFEVNYMGCNCMTMAGSGRSCTSATLQKAPDSIGSCKNLQSLNLAYNNLAELPPWLGSLGNLRYLELLAATQGAANHPSVEFPARASYPELLFASLRENNFYNSGLKIDSFAEMPKLLNLDISETNLTVMPESIGSLRHLIVLDAGTNAGLERIPDSIGNMTSLVVMNLRLTSIKRLPPSIGSLQRLSSLSFQNTNLTTLPDSFCSLKQARMLSLEGNDLVDLPECLHELPEQVERAAFTIANIFSGCSNIRLKYNDSNAGHRSLRKRLGGIWRQRCSCSMTEDCFCNDKNDTQPSCAMQRALSSGCDLCTSQREQEICLSAVDEVNMTSVL